FAGEVERCCGSAPPRPLLMNRIIKSLGTFTHFGDTDTQDAEDDDGGFRNGAPCTLSASSGIIKNDSQGAKKPPSTSSSLCTGREKLLYQYGDKVPGVLGLKNHGNTCFMNAVVQCLSNTDLLAEYLGLERGEPRRVSGEVTEQLASLVRALWTLEYTPQQSVDFKTVVSKYGSQFRGNSQHDALEFLLWLLDRVHEDVILAPHNNNNKVKAPEKVRTTKAISVIKGIILQKHVSISLTVFDFDFILTGYHHSLPSSPYFTGPEGQRLPPSGTLSSEFLNQGVAVKILLLVCNAAGAGQQTTRFGPPFLMREDRSISWEQLQQSILSKLYYLMINGAQAQNARVLFNIRVVGGAAFYSYLSPQDARPLYHPAVERALKLCGSGGPPHVKLIIEWDLFGNIHEEVVKDAESVRNLQQHHVQQHSCTLDECFQLYTKEEQLAPDDAWKCPHCKQLQQGMVKMSLWTLPDILILHLKRFRQVGERRNKLTTFVHFPLAALDMTPHMVHRNNGPQEPLLQPGWNQSRRPDLTPPDFLYDLYAVCNHHGGMHGGHYTAFCRNSVDGQWYSYDDSSAEPVPEAEVCTRGAYILFYQKRNTIPPWSASSSITGSTSSSISDHWLVRLTEGSKRGSMGSAEPSPVLLDPKQAAESPESPVFRDEAPRAVETTNRFIRGTQGRSLSMRSPTTPKESLNKVLPLRWSFGSKDRIKNSAQTQSEELVEYLESGRRPRCTKDPIITLVATPPLRNAHGRVLQVGQDCSSPSGSSLSGTDRLSADICYSPKIPEGQSRTCVDRLLSLRGADGGQSASREDDSLRQGPLKRLRPEQGRLLDFQLHKGAILGGQMSYSAPPSRDSTLRRTKVQTGGPPRAQKDSLQAGLHPEDRKDQGGEEGSSQDNLLSYLKPVFMKKDILRSPVKLQERRMNGHLGKLASSNSAKLSLSNGTLTAAALEDKRGGGIQSCDSHLSRAPLLNGKAGSLDPVDIQRAHSSSSIQNKLDLTFRRCASLQRNGEVAAPPAHRLLLSDKPGSSPLQGTRYSTTSLGRHRLVPEACS
uniref:ubiquitinyl hydrolase 1 n=1 Tax=Oryzias sinensis TaxID=183150 RepID=A0A8C8DVP1_9TELE